MRGDQLARQWQLIQRLARSRGGVGLEELAEELGIKVDLTQAVSVLQGRGPGLNIETWAVASWEGEIVNAAPGEHDEIRWFVTAELDTLDLADEDVSIASRRAIEHFSQHPRRWRSDR